MANSKTGDIDGVVSDDPFAEMAEALADGAPLSGDELELSLEDELMRELMGASDDQSRVQLVDAPSIALDDEELPNLHLGSRQAQQQAAEIFALPVAKDEVLENEYNALLGNNAPALGNEELSAAEADFDAPHMEFDMLEEAPHVLKVSSELVESVEGEAQSQVYATNSEEVIEDPFAKLAAMAEKYRHSTPLAPSLDGWDAPAHVVHEDPPFAAPARAAKRTFAPEIETVDVVDKSYYAVDDLDIPTFYDEPAPVARNVVDDLDADFNDLLTQMSGAGAARQAAAQPDFDTDYRRASQSYAQPEPRIELPRATPHVAAEPNFDAYEAPRARHTAEDFDFDREYDDNMTYPDFARAEPARKPNRSMLAAAIVGGVVLLGGAGALAMSFMGAAGNGAPELVRADQSPLKVRPANPGGAEIPNQNSSVYDAASGRTAALDQKTLVNGTEAPIEMAEELPQNADEDIAAMDEPKNEDRVEETAQQDGAQQGASAQQVAVAPKKVKTMIVKPDGSLAEAAEPAKPQAVAKAAAPKKDAVAEQVAAAKPIAEEKPAVAEDQTTASIPAASGAWATQLASEGSEAAAKATFKKLSAKYPGLLGGKGVAFVKADIPGTGIRWRIRVMSDSRGDASSLCSSLKSKGGNCFVTKT